MNGYRVSYWVTFSLFWAMIVISAAVLLYLLLTRLFMRRSVSQEDAVMEDPFSGTAPRGVDPTVIESFPTIKYCAAQGKKQCGGMVVCVICLGVFKEGETLRSMPACRHVFHSQCVDSWLKSHVTCPCCRTSVLVSGSGFLKVFGLG